MHTAPHMTALEEWREQWLSADRPMPHFDPLDGGSAARLLLLLETPGPGPSPLRFVSRDNPTGTARNLRRFLDEAGISRGYVVLWNAVPWVIHASGARNRAPSRREIAEGIAMLPGVLDRLPRLRVAVLAGRVAALAIPTLANHVPSATLITMPHPSPTYVCTSPEVPARIRTALREAARLLM